MTTQTSQAAVPADTFELRLRIIRFHAGLNVKEAAERVSVSGQTWANWEAGKSQAARQPRTLAFIARQFGVDENWLRNGGPLSRADADPDGGERARQDSNLRPVDYQTPSPSVASLDEHRERRSRRRPPRRKIRRRGVEAA